VQQVSSSAPNNARESSHATGRMPAQQGRARQPAAALAAQLRKLRRRSAA
jgi:hypothetical protein